MIKLIYGAKGSGKTKQIIDAANNDIGLTKGSVVFMGDIKYMPQINTQVRFFNALEYKINNKDQLIGFVKGVLAGNFDITEFYIDGISRITGVQPEEMQDVFETFDYLSMQDDVDFTVTVSTDTLPEYLKKYI